MHRLWLPIPYEPLLTTAGHAAAVKDWTDIGPGDGTRASAITRDLPLSRRTFVVAPDAAPPHIPGWDIERCDLKQWQGRGDCVSLLDVVEHLERPDADRVLTELERRYRVVVVFTPWGFMRQDPGTDARLANDPWMWHRCGFLPDEFERRGYITLGWPLFHPGAQVGAILAVKCESSMKPGVEAAVVRAYARARRRSELPRVVGRWWLLKLRRWRSRS